MTTSAPTRRARMRAQTEKDIKEAALAALADGSIEDVTLSAVARALGMSIAGLYRYFASRDDLLIALAADSYEEFADALEAGASRMGPPVNRLRAVADAYRTWALLYPGRYRLMFASTWGSGTVSPDVTMPDADRAMLAIVTALEEAPNPPVDAALKAHLGEWSKHAGLAHVTPGRLIMAVTTWTRLHGIVSLELEGVWGAMGLDAELLVKREIALVLPPATKR